MEYERSVFREWYDLMVLYEDTELEWEEYKMCMMGKLESVEVVDDSDEI